MADRNVTLREALFTASKEDLVRQAYKDSVGVWTWGFGVTSASGHKVERYIDDIQTYERCCEVYVWLLQKYLDDVLDVFEGYDLQPHVRAAALSFHWNTGKIRSASWVRHWKTGEMARAKSSFLQWQIPKEVAPRRKAEADLLFNAKWPKGLEDANNIGDFMVAEYTRVHPKSYSPVWSSAKKFNLAHPLRAAMASGEAAKSATPAAAPAALVTGGLSIGAFVGLWYSDTLAPVMARIQEMIAWVFSAS